VSATCAAAAGGVTTLVDMPLNAIPPTTGTAALGEKRRAAEGRCRVDVGFWGGLVPGNLGQLEPLHAAGVLGFKAFLVPSGVEEFGHVGAAELEPGARELARLGAPLLVHAESPAELVPAPAGSDPRSYAAWLATRPPAAEAAAIALLARTAAATGARVHVVHLSSRAGLEQVRAARRSGLALSAESCPHYLGFAAEEIPDGGVEWKCAPPIRGRAEREALWEGLADGSIALVASDHSPAPPALKRAASGDLLGAWGGIASLQLLVPALWTSAARRGFGLEALARWLGSAPAALAGLGARKGALAPGLDADLLVLDPEAGFTVEPERLYHRHPMTPWAGLELRGVVRASYLRGAAVCRDGELLGEPAGRLLRR
jgi:allantoinase